MGKRVLSVGQCGMDHGSISRMLSQQFSAETVGVDHESDAIAQLTSEDFDLVLVNRKLDLDGSDGMKVIEHMQADAKLRDIPVMLVSNFADAQETAIAAGAKPGFGKSALGESDTIDRLAAFL